MSANTPGTMPRKTPIRVGFGNVGTTQGDTGSAVVHHSTQNTDAVLDKIPTIEPRNPTRGALFPELD